MPFPISSSRRALSCKISCRPCDLQIKTACQPVQIQNFSRKIQSLCFLRFHGGRIDFLYMHAASGHNGLRISSCTDDLQLPAFDQRNKFLPLLFRNFIYHFVRMNP